MKLCMRVLSSLLFAATVLSSFSHADDGISRKVWSDFRQAFPYHMQAIGLSNRSPDRQVLIISEPPPHVTLDKLRAWLPEGKDWAIHEHPIGYGGWVRDVSVVIDAGETQLNRMLSLLHARLFGTSYKAWILDIDQASYVAHHPFQLDLQVTTAELQQWLETDDNTLKFRPINGQKAWTVNEISQTSHSDVYYSDETVGLVCWWIPVDVALSSEMATIRKFVLDSDLIVGARNTKTGTLIIGRERAVPFHILPPLRAETIIRLASVKSDSLAQSYERNYALAGPFRKENVGNGQQVMVDWAPIYLSPELIDTEYGSLLNLADQHLKGWSMNGEVHYWKFPYPQPDSLPFSKALMFHLGVDELTFNWNTAGAGYTLSDSEGTSFYALNRTGALPISYIPGGDASRLAAAQQERERIDATVEAEETGYEWFAAVNDPLLLRVVQYASLYQIFTRFDIDGGLSNEELTPSTDSQQMLSNRVIDLLMTIRGADVKSSNAAVEDAAFRSLQQLARIYRNPRYRERIEGYEHLPALEEITLTFPDEIELDKLRSLSEESDEVLKAVEKEKERITKQLGGFQAFLSGVSKDDLERLTGDHALKAMISDDDEPLKKSLEILKKCLETKGENSELAAIYLEVQFRTAANELKQLRESDPSEFEALQSALERQFNLLDPVLKMNREVIVPFVSSQNLPKRVLESGGKNPASWIHTAPVVISWTSGASRGVIGGHNLDARVSRFQISTDPALKGRPRVNEDGVVLIHRDDASLVSRLSRIEGRNAKDPTILVEDLRTAIKNAPPVQIRRPELALELETAAGGAPPKFPNNPGRGAHLDGYDSDGIHPRGDRWNRIPPEHELPKQPDVESMVIERKPDATFVATYRDGSEIRSAELYEQGDLVDLVNYRMAKVQQNSGKHMELQLVSFRDKEGAGFLTDIQRKAKNTGVDQAVRTYKLAGNMTQRQANTILKTPLDIKDAKLIELPSNTGYARFKIEIPAHQMSIEPVVETSPEKRTLLGRFKDAFKQRFNGLLSKPPAEKPQLQRMIETIDQEIRRAADETDMPLKSIQHRIHTSAGDIHVTHRDEECVEKRLAA